MWIAFVAVFLGGFQLLPTSTKSTLYFSVKPLGPLNKASANISDPADASEKLAETIAGWAKDPGFRNQIQKKADVVIANFKRKISARKQNRMNVFWTITLSGPEQDSLKKITEATITTLKNTIQNYNQNSPFPLMINTPRISYEGKSLPFAWVVSGIIMVSLFFSVIVLYFSESIKGTISFASQATDAFPDLPTLQISQKLGKHDERLLEQFILTFDSPRLVGTFARAEKFFSLAPRDSINEERDTPVLLVKLGETDLTELKNLVAIFGDEIGIIIFKK